MYHREFGPQRDQDPAKTPAAQIQNVHTRKELVQINTTLSQKSKQNNTPVAATYCFCVGTAEVILEEVIPHNILIYIDLSSNFN